MLLNCVYISNVRTCMLYSNTVCVHSIFIGAFPIILFCHTVLICMYVCVCVCGYTCFKTSKVAHVTITFCIDDQSSVSASTALARWASAHFSAFPLPRTAL